MPQTYDYNTPRDWVAMKVFYKDLKGKLCQYNATSEILSNPDDAVEDCRGQVITELLCNNQWYPNMPVFALIKGSKV